VGVPDELVVPELPELVDPLELLSLPSFPNVTSGTELHAPTTRMRPATATAAVAKEKRTTP